MVERFNEHLPVLVKPSTGKANAKELYFDRLDSGLRSWHCRHQGDRRSKTIRLLHGSEVAFWPNASSHFAGVVQTVPDLPGTEIILESTPTAMGDEFHQRWQAGRGGRRRLHRRFVPWYWH